MINAMDSQAYYGVNVLVYSPIIIDIRLFYESDLCGASPQILYRIRNTSQHWADNGFLAETHLFINFL